MICIYIYIYLSLSLFSYRKKTNGKSTYIVPLSHLTIRTPAIFLENPAIIQRARYWPWPSAPSKCVMNEPPSVGWSFSSFCMRNDAGLRHAIRPRVGDGRSMKLWLWKPWEVWGILYIYILFICMYVYDRIWIIRSHIMYIYILYHYIVIYIICISIYLLV